MINEIEHWALFEGRTMVKNRNRSRGFTLIAALMMMILLSGIAVGLLFLVTNEARMGGNDLEENMSYYAAEAGVENLTALLSQTYQNTQNPTATTINGLTATTYQPTAVSGSNITNVQYSESITWPYSDASGNPSGYFDIVGAGPNQGMVASMIPFNLTVTATRLTSAGQVGSNSSLAATGASSTMSRTVEVALLPAFEFGIFCDGDCDYFAGPPFNFGGRVHTNGNLFLAANTGPLTFTDKIAAAGQVILDRLENGTSAGSGSGSYNGAVYIPSASAACPNAPGAGPATNCNQLNQGSWTGGFPPTGSANAGWRTISSTNFNGFVINGLTGAKKLQLPFVQSSTVGAIDIIRKPTPGDVTSLSNARLYNKASIRILLADFQADLYPGETRSDSATQDIQIGAPFTNLSSGSSGYVSVAAATGVNSAGNMYFATAIPTSSTNNWATAPTGCGTPASWPLFGQVTQSSSMCQGVWLRVEYRNAAGNWTGITREWLSYGFGRNYNQPPTHPYNSTTSSVPLCNNFPSYPTAQCQNGVSPAILILQQLQSGKTAANAWGGSPVTANNWLPINFYDAREGEPRDTRPSGDTGVYCSPNGIMNAVELDVGNLWLWLKSATGTPYSGGSGTLVDATKYNGYILYFSDHRGMIADPRPLTTFYYFSGMSGLADVINSGSAVGVPDGGLESMTYYATATPTAYSPEDVAVKGATFNLGLVDKFGYANLGAGFGITNTGSAMAQPYYIQGSVTSNAIQCYSGSVTTTGSPSYFNSFTPTYNVVSAEWNMVTGPRHVLRLVDGGMDTSANSYVPPTNGTVASNGNGFTVTSEEPVYVWGDYNTGSADPFWPSENTTTTPHSAAAIIADSVTLLSNPPAGNNKQGNSPVTAAANVGWTDLESFIYPSVATSRPGNNTYYRMAIAAGKSIPFPKPSWGGADMGTDGGMHNFLRYLEDRGANSSTVNYAGSMISMYYSQYDTGIFKCCNSTYGAPKRNYFFDTLFLNPANLPPGTPMFQDIVSLSYHETFTPQ